ncbi:MAG: STAS domain-containing protein [Akkermansiaceae bacterium]
MEITESSHPHATVLALHGRLDGHTSLVVTAHLDSILAKGPGQLIFDLSGLEYVSSAGLRVFLTAAKKCQTIGGVAIFAALPPAILDVFELSGFLAVLQVRSTVAEALGQP